MSSTQTPTRTRYTGEHVERAKEHSEAGWPLSKIVELLEDEFGVSPCHATVLLWVNPDYAKKFAERNRERMRKRWQREHPPKPQKISAELALKRMQELHARGVSPRAIGQVAALWWGEEMTDDQVRSRLGGRRAYRKRAA